MLPNFRRRLSAGLLPICSALVVLGWATVDTACAAARGLDRSPRPEDLMAVTLIFAALLIVGAVWLSRRIPS